MRRATSSASFFLGADAITKLLPFLLIPFLTLNLGAVEYAELSRFYMYSALFLAILNPGFDVYLNRMFIRESPDQYRSNLLLSIVVCVLLAFLLLVLIYNAQLERVFIFSALYAFLQSISLVVISYFQIRVMSRLYFFVNVVGATVSTCLTLYLFIYVEGFVEYRYESLLVGMLALIFTGVILILCVDDGRWKITSCKISIVSISMFCMPLIVHNLSMYFRQYADKWIVDISYESSVLSIFYLAFQLVSVVTILILALNKFLTREIMERIENGMYWRLEKSVIVFFLILLMIIELVLYVLPNSVYNYFLGEEFSGINIFIMYMIPGVLSQILYIFYSSPLFFYGETGKLSLITLLSSVVSVIYLAVVSYCDAGLVFLAFSYLVSMMITIFLSRAYIKARYV